MTRDTTEDDELHCDLEGLIELWYTVADSYKELGNMDKYHSYRACADQLARVRDGGTRDRFSN